MSHETRTFESLFIATERFDPSDGVKWNNYVEWTRIPNLREVVSLDCMLCSHLPEQMCDEDWPHIVNESFRLGYFYDLDYLAGRVADKPRRNILGLYRNSETHIPTPPGPGQFVFLGYDLIEEQTQISALTNCGGFPEIFSNDELNEFGLVHSFTRTREIRQLLAKQNPEEPHAQCEMYAILRLAEDLHR